MNNIFSDSQEQGVSMWLLFLILSGYVLAAMFLFNFVGLLLISPFYGFDFVAITDMLANPMLDSRHKVPLLILQGVASFGGFIVAPAYVVRKYGKVSPKQVVGDMAAWQGLVLTAAITFSFMVVNSVLIEWNESITFPQYMSGIESYLRSSEDQLADLTMYLTTFDSPIHFIVTLIVVALLAAVGEEFLFRGILQNIFRITFSNPHVAIWVTAFLFAAFHNQFFGLVPRMLLGAIFGYLFYWSGSLWVAMLAHFINNAFSLFMFYLYQKGLTEYNMADGEALPNNMLLLVFFVANIILLVVFKRFYQNGRVAKSI